MGERFVFPFLWSVVKRLPGGFLFRSPQFRFFSPLMILLLLILGRVSKKNYNKFFCLITLIVLFFNVFAFFHGDMFGEAKNIVIPNDYKQVLSYLQEESNSHNTVLVLPKFDFTPDIIWRNSRVYAYPILDQLLQNPTIMHIYSYDRVPRIFRSIYESRYPIENLGMFLGKNNVRFILTYKDSSYFPLSTDLSRTNGITKIVSGENIDLYEVDISLMRGLIFTESGNVNYQRIAPGKYLIKSSLNENSQTGCLVTFNREFDDNIVMFSLGNDNSSEIKAINKPGFNLKDISLLKFPIVPKMYRKSNNGYGNTWDICNYEGNLLIYHYPQILFYIGTLVTGISFVFVFFYLLFFFLNGGKLTANKFFD